MNFGKQRRKTVSFDTPAIGKVYNIPNVVYFKLIKVGEAVQLGQVAI